MSNAPTDTFIQNLAQAISASSVDVTIILAAAALTVGTLVVVLGSRLDGWDKAKKRRARNQKSIDESTRNEHRPGGLENWK